MRRIGAEQELFLVDRDLRPKACVLPGARSASRGTLHDRAGAVQPRGQPLRRSELGGDCLARMERGAQSRCSDLARGGRVERGRADPACAASLPTLERQHLGLEWMTPIPRYLPAQPLMIERAAERQVRRARSRARRVPHGSHDNVMLEACNTSFQVHWQVRARSEFAQRLQPGASSITAPLLACAVNSPRPAAAPAVARDARRAVPAVARHALGDRRPARQRAARQLRRPLARELDPRDLPRGRRALPLADRRSTPEESPLDGARRAAACPQLKALRLHNGTVYRWNRPCYGVHRRQGRTCASRTASCRPARRCVDEIANAAFFFGLMSALPEEYGDVARSR